MVDNAPTTALETPAGEVSSDLNSLIEQFKHDVVLKGDFSTFISGLPSSTQTLVHKYLDSLEAGTIKPEDTYAPELIVLINSLATAFVMNNKLVAVAKAAELAAVPEAAATVIDIPAPVEQPKITDMAYTARKEYIDGVIAAGNVETLVEEMTDGSTKQIAPEQDVSALIAGKTIKYLYGEAGETAAIALIKNKLKAGDVSFVANTMQQMALRGVMLEYNSFGAGIWMTAFISSYHSLQANMEVVGIEAKSAYTLITPIVKTLADNSTAVITSMEKLFTTNGDAFANITDQAVRVAIDLGSEGERLANTLLDKAATQKLPVPSGEVHILTAIQQYLSPLTYAYIGNRIEFQKAELVRQQAAIAEANASAVKENYIGNKDGLGQRIIVADNVIKIGGYVAPKQGQDARLGFDFARNNNSFAPGSPLYELFGGKAELLNEILNVAARSILVNFYKGSPTGSTEQVKESAERTVAAELSNMLWTFAEGYNRAVKVGSKQIVDPMADQYVIGPNFIGAAFLVALLNSPAYSSPIAANMKLTGKFYLPAKYLPTDATTLKRQLYIVGEMVDLIADETSVDLMTPKAEDLTPPVPEGLLAAGETMLLAADGTVRNLVNKDTLTKDITSQLKREFDRGSEQSISSRFAVYKKAQADEVVRQRVEELKAAAAKISDYVNKYGAKYHKDGDLSLAPVVPKFALPATRTEAEAAVKAYQLLLAELQKIDLGKPSTNLQEIKTLLSSTITELGGKLPLNPAKPPQLVDLRNEVIRSVNNMRTGDQSVDVKLDTASGLSVEIRVAIADVVELPTNSDLEQITDFDAFMQSLEAKIAAGAEKYAQQVRAYAERVIDTLFSGEADSRLLKFIRSQNIELSKLDVDNKALWQKLVAAFLIGRFNSAKDMTKLMNTAIIDDPLPARALIRAVGVFAYNLQLPLSSRYGFAMVPGNLTGRWKEFNGDQEPTEISRLAGIMLTAFRQNDISKATILDIPAAA